MKAKKLNLNDLKVKSFVTSFEGNRESTVKGGSNAVTHNFLCNTDRTSRGCSVQICD